MRRRRGLLYYVRRAISSADAAAFHAALASAPVVTLPWKGTHDYRRMQALLRRINQVHEHYGFFYTHGTELRELLIEAFVRASRPEADLDSRDVELALGFVLLLLHLTLADDAIARGDPSDDRHVRTAERVHAMVSFTLKDETTRGAKAITADRTRRAKGTEGTKAMGRDNHDKVHAAAAELRAQHPGKQGKDIKSFHRLLASELGLDEKTVRTHLSK